MLFLFRIVTKTTIFPIRLVFKIFKYRLISVSKIIIMISGIYSLARYAWQNKEKTSRLNQKFNDGFPQIENFYSQIKNNYTSAEKEKREELSDEFGKIIHLNKSGNANLHSDKEE
ncbi:MAG: hypothetical protein CL792_01180 [Chloroflexi bacterium]|nr:hypothetical protein [Chloroflexota bacterium]HCU80450.1 hypothetical protein [Chloroflexota bacterium]